MPSGRCWKLAACRQARSKRGDLPSKARNAVVSDGRKTALSEIRELAQKNWWNSRSRQWNAFLCEREEQVFLVLTLFIGALVGVVVVAFILVTSRFGARLYPAGGAAWRRLLVPVAGSAVMGYLLFRFFRDARGSGVPQTKAALYARGGRILTRHGFRKVILHFRDACQRDSARPRRSSGSSGRGNRFGAGQKTWVAPRKSEGADP